MLEYVLVVNKKEKQASLFYLKIHQNKIILRPSFLGYHLCYSNSKFYARFNSDTNKIITTTGQEMGQGCAKPTSVTYLPTSVTELH